MATERLPIAVDPAMRRPLGDIGGGAKRFTEARVERILAVVVAMGCTVLGAQSFLNALGSTQESHRWHIALMIVAFVPLALMIGTLFVGVLGRAMSRFCAIALVLVIASWPLATSGVVADPADAPWIWYLLNVATAAAVMGFRMPLQLVWAVLVPLVYAIVRLEQVGTAKPEVIAVTLDAGFALILAGVILALGWMLRTVAIGIDRARADAVASYAAAAAADAAETERVAVAALMHDSVLAALIAGERATTPREEALAMAMAREALTRLANAEQDAGEGSDELTPPASVLASIASAAAELGVTLPPMTAVAASAAPIPGRVARAIVLAATQAMANAVQHAGGQGLSVEVQADAASIAVRITDRGPGFDPAAVDADRLGIRGSIVARMAAAGGRARVRTSPSGTSVLLEWEHAR